MRGLVLLSLLAVACTPDFDLPSQGSGHGLLVRVEPIGSLDSAPSVLRLRVEGAAGRAALGDFHFFSGTLGAYHLGRIRRRDLPATLLEREVPLLVWAEPPDVLVAPLEAIPTGTYSLAEPGLGLVAEAVVDAELVPVVTRTWPPAGAIAGAGAAVFCGDAAAAVAVGPAELEPTGVAASIASGLDESGAFPSCVVVELAEEVATGVPLLVPALAGGASLEPRLLVVESTSPRLAGCVAPEVALGPVCAAPADDRVELHAIDDGAFLALDGPRRLLGSVARGRSLVLRGFEPSSVTRVRGVAFDALGVRTALDLELRTTERRSHVVLNEVLADPRGAEATSEWVELVNDGTETTALDGYLLDDSVEPVVLPSARLAPGEFLLVVAEGFAPDPELDLVPPPGTKLLVVPRLGRAGLANGGELLRLRDPDGNVVSRFPALKAPGPGQSVARRTRDAPDAEAASFAPHAAPGASPGAENGVVDE